MRLNSFESGLVYSRTKMLGTARRVQLRATRKPALLLTTNKRHFEALQSSAFVSSEGHL